MIPSAAAPWKAPSALPDDRVLFVETIHRRFLQSLSRRLTESLETPVTAELSGTEQMRFADFLASCHGESCPIALNAKARAAQAILELTPGFLHRVLALLIGAPLQESRPERSISGIERHILRECVDGITTDLREIWASQGVEFEPDSIAREDEPAASLPPDGSAVVATFQVSFGGSQESLRLALPALMVRLAAEGMHETIAPSSAASRPMLLEALRAAEVRVEAVMSGPSLRMRDLVGLAPGQVLMLGAPANCSIECTVNGVSKFRGELVSSGRNQGFQIDAPIEPGVRRTD